MDAEGAASFTIKDNTVVAKEAGAKLRVRIHGLDPNRDLDVRIRATASAGDKSAETGGA